MLRLVVSLAAVALLTEAATCPDKYNLMGRDRCIRPLNLWVKGQLSALLPMMTKECEKDKAHLPIIKSAQDNAMFNDIVASFDQIKDNYVFLVLGMVCNTSTRKLEWADNSPITFIQLTSPISLDFDCVQNENHVVSRVKFNDWFVVPDDTTLYTYTFLCEADPTV